MKRHETWSIKSDWIWLAALLLGGACLRVAAIVGYGHAPESDELAYQSMATNLLAGNGIVENGNRAFYNAGYPMFVLAPVFYVFGESLLAARIANLMLGLASIVLCYSVAKEFGAGRFGRLLAAAIWAFYLPTGIYGVYLAKENLMIPLMLGVMWCSLRLLKNLTLKLACLCGLFLGLLAMVGNAALTLSAVVVLALFIAPHPAKQRAIALVAIVSVSVLVSLPWMLRNLNVVGAPVMNTNGGFNLYLGNNPAATGYFVSIADTPRGSTWHELRRTSGELGATEALREEAISWIKENPGDFLALAFRKAAYFWTPPLHEGKGGNASTAESVARVVWAAQFFMLTVAALAGVFSARLRNKPYLLLWSAIACYTAVHMLFYVIYRYREPIMPIVGIIAAIALEAFAASLITRKA